MSLDKKMKMEVESTEQDGSSLGESHNLVTIMFDVGHQSGELKDALNFFWKHDINLTRIESRPDIRGENYEVSMHAFDSLLLMFKVWLLDFKNFIVLCNF